MDGIVRSFSGNPCIPFALVCRNRNVGRGDPGTVLGHRRLLGVIRPMFIIATDWIRCFALLGCSGDAGSDFDGDGLVELHRLSVFLTLLACGLLVNSTRRGLVAVGVVVC